MVFEKNMQSSVPPFEFSCTRAWRSTQCRSNVFLLNVYKRSFIFATFFNVFNVFLFLFERYYIYSLPCTVLFSVHYYRLFVIRWINAGIQPESSSSSSSSSVYLFQKLVQDCLPPVNVCFLRSYDLDLDRMTLIHELALDILMINLYANIEFLGLGFQKLESKQSDRQKHRRARPKTLPSCSRGW